MDWKVIAALGFLVLALIAGLVICVLTSVNAYAKRLAEEPHRRDKRRGFEVATTEKLTDGDARPD